MKKKIMCVVLAAVLIGTSVGLNLQVKANAIAGVDDFLVYFVGSLLASMGVNAATKPISNAVTNYIQGKLDEKAAADAEYRTMLDNAKASIAAAKNNGDKYVSVDMDDYKSVVTDVNSWLNIDSATITTNVSAELDLSTVKDIGTTGDPYVYNKQIYSGFNFSTFPYTWDLGSIKIDIDMLGETYILFTATTLNGNKYRTRIPVSESQHVYYKKQLLYSSLTTAKYYYTIPFVSYMITSNEIALNSDPCGSGQMYIVGDMGPTTAVVNYSDIKSGGSYIYYADIDTWSDVGTQSWCTMFEKAKSVDSSYDLPVDVDQNIIVTPASSIAGSYANVGSIPLAILESYVGTTAKDVVTTTPTDTVIDTPNNPSIDITLPDIYPVTGEVSISGPVTVTGDIAITGVDDPTATEEKLKTPSVLLTKFPFCIPFDLLRCISELSAPASDPIWTIPIDAPDPLPDQELTIDLTQYEMWFAIFRWMLALLFMWGLIIGTRYLIRG